jgi:TRAP-type uncharacterized transport system fused permease subunit
MLSGGLLPIALHITMIASMILGAGVSTVVAYLLVAVTAAAAGFFLQVVMIYAPVV